MWSFETIVFLFFSFLFILFPFKNYMSLHFLSLFLQSEDFLPAAEIRGWHCCSSQGCPPDGLQPERETMQGLYKTCSCVSRHIKIQK